MAAAYSRKIAVRVGVFKVGENIVTDFSICEEVTRVVFIPELNAATIVLRSIAIKNHAIGDPLDLSYVVATVKIIALICI